MKYPIAILLIILLACSNSDESDKTLPAVPYKHVDLFTGLEHPWGLDFLGDKSLLITERPGRMVHWQNGVMHQVSGLPLSMVSKGQGGLMDVLVYASNQNTATVFFTASNEINGKLSTAVFTAQFNLQTHSLSQVNKLYQATPLIDNGGHFGSRIVIDKQGYLFLGLGERQQMELAQDNTNSSGTVVRLHLDGSIPSTNPFVDNDDILDEIWSYGHRNIQGMFIHPETEEIWTHEHGPQGGDEINILKKGGNFGWPLATYGIDYDGSIISEFTHYPGTIQPEFYWAPSIAPCGMEIYSGKVFPQWKHHIFVGALAKQHVNRLSVNKGTVTEEERLFKSYGRFRAIKEGPDGLLYLLSEGNGGKLSRIEVDE